MSLTIQVRNGNVEQAMRVLKKKLQKDGLLKSLKDKQYYLEEKISSIEGRYKKTKDLGKLNNVYPKTILDNHYGICDQILGITYNREYWILDKVRITLDKNIGIKNLKKKIGKSLNLNKISV